jgi:ATP-dependent DNA helicase RecQ
MRSRLRDAFDLNYELEALETALSNRAQLPPEQSLQLDALRFFLRELFRKRDFLPGQIVSICRLLQRKPTITLLPTGGGKSIIFQLSGLLLPGVTVIIAPLVGLIEDQIVNLRSVGIDHCDSITSVLGPAAKEAAMDRMDKGQVTFLYVAPERFQHPGFRERFRKIAINYSVSLAVIDEAHCVSEWGHDFRPSYLHLGRNLRTYASDRNNRPPTLAALTGTASFAVLLDIQDELGVSDEKSLVVPTSFDRPELHFAVIKVRTMDRSNRLLTLMKELPRMLGEESENFFQLRGTRTNAGIVFCPHVNGGLGVKAVAAALGTHDYYAGSAPKDFQGNWYQHKASVIERFKSNECAVITASKALGMGFDKENVRFTVHYCIPESVEAFYQEAGRAGRNGQKTKSVSVVLFANGDEETPLYFFKNSFPDSAKESGDVRLLWDELQKLARVTPEGEFITVSFHTNETEQGRQEKTIYRLMLLGLIEDYGKDWQRRFFLIKPREFERDRVLASLRRIIGRQRFQEDVDHTVGEVAASSDDKNFVSMAADCLLGFVYKEIADRRRQAVHTMAELCRFYKNPEEFRAQILAYLEESEFSVELGKWRGRSLKEIGLAKISDLLAKAGTVDALRRLVGSTRRFLDEEPANLPVRVLSIASRCRNQHEGVTSALAELDSLFSHAVALSPNSLDKKIISLFIIDQFIEYRDGPPKECAHRILSAWPEREVAIGLLPKLGLIETESEALSCRHIMLFELAPLLQNFRLKNLPA